MHPGDSTALNHEHPTQPKSTPEPAQQHPHTKVGDPLVPGTAPPSPSHPQQPLGSGSRRFAVSVPPLGLISAHSLQLIATPQM